MDVISVVPFDLITDGLLSFLSMLKVSVGSVFALQSMGQPAQLRSALFSPPVAVSLFGLTARLLRIAAPHAICLCPRLCLYLG